MKKRELYGDNIDNNEYQKWENSIEGILCDLQMIGDATVEDDRNKILIAKTLIALPEEIRNKVLSEVLFVLLEVYGIAGCLSIPVPKGCKEIEQPFILLNFSLIEKESEDCKMDFIAHEIAHFILGHHKSMTYDPLEKKKGLKGQAHHWRLIKSPFLFEELIVENEIATLKDISERCFSNKKMECNYNNITADENITIYGFPSHFSTISSNLSQQWETSDKEFNEIRTRMKKDMEDLYKLAIRRKLCIFYEKINELVNPPIDLEDLPSDVEKFLELCNRSNKRNKNGLELTRDSEVIKAFLKMRQHSEEDISPLDMGLCAVFLYCLIFEQRHQLRKWFDLQKTSIVVKADMELMEFFRDFYPSKEKNEIWGMLEGHDKEGHDKDYEIDRELSEKLKWLVDFYNHLSPIHLIAVMHGGSADKRELSSSDLCQLVDIIDSEHTKAYRRLSEQYHSEKLKVTPDEILDGITR